MQNNRNHRARIQSKSIDTLDRDAWKKTTLFNRQTKVTVNLQVLIAIDNKDVWHCQNKIRCG